FLTRPVLFDFIATKTDLENASNELFAAILSADVTIEINQTWPMAEVAAAHRALEERRTTGSSLLTI
ncbi:MAG: quinone oxidoreductase, partial [Gammaproteobacteria bacterium]